MNPSVVVVAQVPTERCPWCDSVISHSKFVHVQARIAEQERKKLAAERARIQEELGHEKEEFEARVREDANKKLAVAAEQRDQVAMKLKAVEGREAKVRQQAVAEAEARIRAEADRKLKAAVAERDQAAAVKLKTLEAREATVRQQAAAETEARVKAEADKKLKATMSERDQVSSKLKAVEKQVEQQRRDLAQQRTALEKDRDVQLLKQDSQHNRQREQLQEKVDALTRQLQRKTANDLGDGAEIDVYDGLRDAFGRDDISRIKKGQPGADICHRVIHKGAVCGTILIDAKNRQGWQNAYVTKLREDQVTGKAEYAVLATTVFPAGKKDLYVDDDTKVIVVSRARAVELVRLLRDAMVRVHSLGLGQEQRSEKRELLYKYLTSEDYRQHIGEANRLTTELLDLDTEEKRTHDKVWEKRGRWATRLRNVVREVDTEVSAIIEGRSGTSGGR